MSSNQVEIKICLYGYHGGAMSTFCGRPWPPRPNDNYTTTSERHRVTCEFCRAVAIKNTK